MGLDWLGRPCSGFLDFYAIALSGYHFAQLEVFLCDNSSSTMYKIQHLTRRRAQI